MCVIYSCTFQKEITMPTTKTHVIRLKPGEDLKKSILQFVTNNNIKAGWIGTCAGSLTQYNIRFANQNKPSSDTGHFEIVSLTGTLSINGSHLHISISDSTGKTIGGHLLDNNIIYTTAEIVIQESTRHVFTRKNDGTTPWEELQVEEIN
jgi:predicted DNA-binding protein with PD1-like motif